MRQLFYLSTCSTCQRFLKQLAPLPTELVCQDIKHQALRGWQLDDLRRLSGRYEALFNRRSQKYQAQGLKDQVLSEEAYRALILEEYTFLKRPVLVWDDHLYIGASAEVVQRIRTELPWP